MTCPPTFAAPVPSDASESEAPSLPADLFMRLYPWMSAGDACLYAAIDRCLAKKASVSLPGIGEGVLRRQWTAEPLAGDNVETAAVDYEPNGSMPHGDLLVCATAGDIFWDYAAFFEEEEEEETCADVWSGHRLILSIAADDRRAIRFVPEYIGPTVRRAPRKPYQAALCPGADRTARQMALAARIDTGLAAVPHDWVRPWYNSLAGAAQSPVDDGTVDLHVRHVVAEAHRRGARYSSAPGRVTLSIHDGIGFDRKSLLSFVICHGDGGGDDTNGGPGSVETGQAAPAQEYPLVQPSIGRTFSVAAPSSPRRRRQGMPWQAVHTTDDARRKPFNTDADEKEIAAPAERRAVPCGDRAVFASHRMPPAKRGTTDDGDHDDDDDTRRDRDIDSTNRAASERRAAPVRTGTPYSPLTETATTTTQTVADIVALYPDLTAEQAARVFAASAQLDKLPYAWVAIETFGRGRCMATSLRASAAAMLRLKTDYDDAADWYGGRRVVLALGNARDTILYRVVGEGAPEAKTQTDDDLAALYPHLSPIEMMGVGAINRALHSVPRVWVGGAGRYPHRVSLGPGGPPVSATIEAVRRLCDHAAASHMVLTLGRTPAGVLTLDYGAVVPRRY
ncbi:hypothetical protein pdul_cds_978 [Pandoravirus dulcis]|uniref:DUF5860 domain-containing protein n=1 Tax=Pandoravirus dulcis TaxID=1349409 RepID=S4VSF5_9VIRU|nr:hypothetical protein pdul_cds_978 [Pandoravirus dulcis]AGO83237.1 hypothetical protein pdul_cds_978 [Pandoravirus dulcis]